MTILTALLATGCGGRATPAGNVPARDDVAPTIAIETAAPADDVLAAASGDPGGSDPELDPDDRAPTGALCSFETPPLPNNMLLSRSLACRSAMCLFTGLDRARCTDLCRDDSDCPAAGPTCQGGFICAARFAVGPPACCRLCICREALRDDEQRDLFGCQQRTCGLGGR